MNIQTIAVGAGILAAIALLISRAKAAPVEVLTLELECEGGSLDACPPSSNLFFSGDYTSDGIPIEDTVHIVQFDSESDANNDINGTEVSSIPTVSGYYSHIEEAPSVAGTIFYKAYNDEQYVSYALALL